MQNIEPIPAHFELPRALIYSVALTCGVLAALAAQIWLARSGYDPAAVLQSPISATSLQLRAAGPWWAIAGAAFVVSGLSAAVLNRWGSRWRRFRTLRWVLAALIVFGLAHIGHSAAGQAAAANAAAQVVASLAVLGVALLMALLAAFLTVRR